MRIDEEGAYVGLVGGSPTRTQPHARKRDPQAPLDSRDARFVTELVFGKLLMLYLLLYPMKT
jgi:hypothetical protein